MMNAHTRRRVGITSAMTLAAIAGTALPLLAQQAPNGAPGLPGEVPVARANGTVLLDFGKQSVEITAFTEYVGQALGLNIIIKDEGLNNQRLIFQAPIEVPKTELLTLLTSIVEDKGYALTRDPLGFYIIEAGQNVDPIFNQDEFSTTRVFRTPLVKPSALQNPVSSALGEGTQMRFTAFDDLGVLMVTGSPKTLHTVETIIDRILTEIRSQTLTRFQLENVSAEFALQRTLVLNGQMAAGSATALGQPVVPGQATTQATVAGSLLNLESRLIVDRGNSLIFRGSEVEAERVRQFVEMVDRIVPLTVKRYYVGSAVNDVADVVQQLGLGSVRSAQQGGQQGGALARPVAGGAGPATTEISGSSMIIDEDEGAITYFGTDAQHEIFNSIVEDFTAEQTEAAVEIRMYKLENAQAESVASVLEQLIADPREQEVATSPFLPGSRQGLPGFLGPGAQGPLTPEGPEGAEGAESGFNIRAEEVIIVPDEDRNQIVVKASAREQRQIERVIEDLDQRQPQVYIEAQIVSVVSNDTFNWTIETQINAGQFLLFTNFGLSEPTAGPDGQPTGNKVVPAGSAGITTALIKSDFVPFIINALQEETNARLQSTPRILVQDNESGSVSSQREEPFSTTSQGTATTVTGQGGTATAGTTLTVTPQISAGGYITLDYSVELSSFQGTGTSGLQPPRQSENYTSRVQVPTDSTIVVGGFTLESDSVSESGVPILKDIPLIGALFKTYGKTNQRTTIFVFITPRIINDENFLDLRLATEGPMKIAGIEGSIPELLPAVIPIREESLLVDRTALIDEAPREIGVGMGISQE